MVYIDEKRRVTFDGRQFILATFNDGINPFDPEQKPSKQTYFTSHKNLADSLTRQYVGEAVNAAPSGMTLEEAIHGALGKLLTQLTK